MVGNPARSSKKDAPEESDKGRSLNFKVTPEFKKEFKGYAVSRGISMVELLKEGFALSEEATQPVTASRMSQPQSRIKARSRASR